MSWKDKNVLVTGVSGFVGSYLSKYLLEQEANVYGFYKKKADGARPKNLVDRGVCDEVKLIDGDLMDITDLARAMDISSPQAVFHLGAQSFVQRSFDHPSETMKTNTTGTLNLLEAMRIKGTDATVVFAGSSEEYGLVFYSQEQYAKAKEKYGSIFPEPEKIPELPISEKNPLRPMSPYAVTKVHGDYLMRNYYHSYGIKTVVSRGFNHEGAGRGVMFVTSRITKQAVELKLKEIEKMTIGNVNAFRDWSHVQDVVRGYCLLAEKGKPGEVYNQGSMRTNSVISYILLSLENVGYAVKEMKTIKNGKQVKEPTQMNESEMFGVKFAKTKVDEMILKDELEFAVEDEGIEVETDKGKVRIEFDQKYFRPAEVPILLSDTRKIQELGFEVTYELKDIIKDQLNFYVKEENRLLKE